MKALRLTISFFFKSWLLGVMLCSVPFTFLSLPATASVQNFANSLGFLAILSFILSLPMLLPMFVILALCKPWVFPKPYQIAFLTCLGLFLSFGWLLFLSQILFSNTLLELSLILPFVISTTIIGALINRSKKFSLNSLTP